MQGANGVWERCANSNGLVFYVNRTTRETSLTLPASIPLPVQWEERVDSLGRVFFVNHETKETTWIDPRVGLAQTLVPQTFSSNEKEQANNALPQKVERFEQSSSSPQIPPMVSTELSLEHLNPIDEPILGIRGRSISKSTTDSELLVQELPVIAPILVRLEDVVCCFHCKKQFSLMRRKHHCKLCGYVFCADCSPHRVQLPIDEPAYKGPVQICLRCNRNVANEDYYSIVGIRRQLSLPILTSDEKYIFMMQLVHALNQSREETTPTIPRIGLDKIAQLNDVEAAGGVGAFCALLMVDDAKMLKATLHMLVNLMNLQNMSQNEYVAGEAFARSGACLTMIQVLKTTKSTSTLRLILELISQICSSKVCQDTLREVGAGARLQELLSARSSEDIETKASTVECLMKYVYDNTDNIRDLLESNGVKLLCGVLNEFLILRRNSIQPFDGLTAANDTNERLESALVATLEMIYVCLNVFEARRTENNNNSKTPIPGATIRSFMRIAKSGVGKAQFLSFQILIRISKEPSLIPIIIQQNDIMEDLKYMCETEGVCTESSQILAGLCSTAFPDNLMEVGEICMHEEVLRVIYTMGLLDVALENLKGCLVGKQQFVGEINFQYNLCVIAHAFSDASPEYAARVCDSGCIPVLSEFLLSKKYNLVPICAQTLMKLCEFRPEVFDQLYESNASDFFHRLLQTPDDNRLSALKYFHAVIDNRKPISNAVLDTLFELATGRDATLKSQSLDIIAKLSGVASVMRLTDPLEVHSNSELAALVDNVRHRVLAPAFFPGLLQILVSESDVKIRINSLKCLRCAIGDIPQRSTGGEITSHVQDGRKELTATSEDNILQMIQMNFVRAICTSLTRFCREIYTKTEEVNHDNVTLDYSIPLVQLLSLIFQVISSSQMSSIAPDNYVKVLESVVEFMIETPVTSRLRLALVMHTMKVILDHPKGLDLFLRTYIENEVDGGEIALGQAVLSKVVESIRFETSYLFSEAQDASTASQNDVNTPTSTQMFDDGLSILSHLFKEITENSAMEKLLKEIDVMSSFAISIRLETPFSQLTNVLDILMKLLVQSRSFFLAMLEGKEALRSLVAIYVETSANYGNLSPDLQEIAIQTGRLIRQVSSDPLRFRTILYNHRSDLPATILSNVLSPVREVADIAESIVVNLADTDFAVCPLWHDLIKDADVRLAYQLVVGTQTPSVQVIASRKLADIVHAHPETLQQQLSAEECQIVVANLIHFLVDSDIRKSGVGLKALHSILQSGQRLNEKQMEEVATAGANQLIYWMAKGMVEDQDYAVTILHDGITNAHAINQFYRQLKEEGDCEREYTFLAELVQQLSDLKPERISSRMKRCALLRGLLVRMDKSALRSDAEYEICSVSTELLNLINHDNKPELGYLLIVLELLVAETYWKSFCEHLISENAIEVIVKFLQEVSKMSGEGNYSQPELVAAILDASTRLLQALSSYDVNRFVSSNGVNVLLGALQDSTIPISFLELFKAISSNGKIGKLALIDANGFQVRLESTFSGIVQILVQSSITTMSAKDMAHLQTACDVSFLIVDLGQEMKSREVLSKSSILSMLSLFEWFTCQFTVETPNITVDFREKFLSLLGTCLPFVECITIMSEKLETDQLSSLLRVYDHVIRYYTNHLCSELLALSYDGLLNLSISFQQMVDWKSDNLLVELLPVIEQQCKEAMTNTAYSIESMSAMIDLSFSRTMYNGNHAPSWLVNLLVHVLIHCEAYDDRTDPLPLLRYLLFCIATPASRKMVLQNSKFSDLVQVLSHNNKHLQSRQARLLTMKILLLVGATSEALMTEKHKQVKETCTIKDNLDRGLTIRCVQCTELQVCSVKKLLDTACAKCKQPITISSNIDLSKEFEDGNTERRLSNANVKQTCRFCNKVLDDDFRFSISSRNSVDISICSQCKEKVVLTGSNEPAIKLLQPNNRDSPSTLSVHSDNISKERDSGEQNCASEISPSRSPNQSSSPSSSANIDRYDTSVVSCNHCGKHLVVRNDATKVKCPSCNGISPLSTQKTLDVMRCKNCNTLLRLPPGARAYKCMKCLQTTRLS